MRPITIAGREAIAEAELAEREGWTPVPLYAFGNEIDGCAGGEISIEKAREIVREDPGLVWCEVPLREYSVRWARYAFVIRKRATPTPDALAALCDAATEWCTAHEGDARSIVMRPVREGEADGIYCESDGLRMRSGADDGEGAYVADLVHRAWGHVLERAEVLCREAGVQLFADDDCDAAR